MKKLIYSAAVLALAFFAGSCQRENLEPVAANGTVTYTVQVPGAIATKADDGVNNVDKLVYEVYRTAGEKVTAFSGADHCLYHREAEVKDGKAEIALEFVNDQNFTVLFWAYDSSTNVYDVDDLTNVTIASTAAANTHETAAFTGVDFVVNCVSDQGGDVKLTRPVAQLNIATTPESLEMDDTDITVSESYVKVYGLSTSFNVAKQEAGDATGDVTYTQAAVLGGAVTVAAKDYPCLAMNYLGFIPTAGASVKVDYLLKTSEGDIDNTIENVPVKPNYRTNIVGNLISGTQDYNVTLDAEWAEETLQVGNAAVSTAEDFIAAFERIIPGVPANIKLEGDIDLSQPAVGTLSTKAGETTTPVCITIENGETVVIDLNGHTISQEVAQTSAHQMILNDGTLTIEDSVGGGKISYKDLGEGGEYISDAIYNRSVLVINGGTIENLSSVTVATNGYPHAVDTYSGIRNTSLTINGGTIYCAEYSAVRMFCVSATNAADLVINGGTIKGAIDMQNGSKAAAVGTLTINDGTFQTTKNANNIRFANWNGGATEYGLTAAIKGGSFNGGITTKYVPAAANWNKGIITGGTFAVDPSEYLVDGYYALKYDDEEYYRIYDNFDPEHRTFTVNSKEELLRLSDLSAKWADFFSNGEGTEYSNYAEQNGGKGTDFYYNWTWTIKLTVDIDFEGETIEPIDLGKRKCFDGQGHTIKNAKIETSSDAGLFNAAQCGLKNLVIENVQVKTSDSGATAGILASSCNAGVENITIRNSSVYGGKYTGGVVGYGYTDVTNCTLTECTVSGSYKCGGIIGYICASNDQTRKVDNNTLTDCTVDFTGMLTAGKTEFVCGMVVGNYNCDGTCSNNTIDNMTTVATGLIGRTEPGNNVTVTGTNFKVATTEALQAALDNATDGTTITLVPGVSYDVVYMGRPTKHNATVMTCETHVYTTTNAVAFKDHLSDGAYHTTPKYTTTLKNLTVVGAEGAKIAGLLATSGHSYGDVYDYVLDKDYDIGSAYYNTLILNNVLFSNVDFTGKIDINTSDATSVYDGVTFDGCTFTTGGTASTNGASIRYYNEANNGNVKNIVVKNCSFTNSYQGVYVQNVNGVTVTDSRFDTTGHNAVAVQSTGDPVNMKDVVIKANNFNNINDRVIRFGAIGADSNITIQNNTAVNSGDEDGEVMRAVSIAAGITTSISGNNWGEGKVVANDELKDE